MPWELTLEQQGGTVSGTMVLYTGRANGRVVGFVTDDGELLLAGTLRLGDEPYSAQLRHWRLNRAGDALNGRGGWIWRKSPSLGRRSNMRRTAGFRERGGNS